MSNNGATMTQGQSIPTALFDKMFGKDNGMPGQDELLSTMQDRSESSAKYKVGDLVWFENELWRVGNINDEPHVSLSYDLDAWGAAVKRKVSEDMLTPAEEAAQ